MRDAGVLTGMRSQVVRSRAVPRAGTRALKVKRAVPPFVRPALLVAAAVLMAAAVFLPLWGMTLVSIQYPEGLRMIVYPTRIVGDIAEINALNRYIGMAQISPDYFGELRVIVALFAGTAALCLAATAVRRKWIALAPLVLMTGAAVYGFWRMRVRLYQYGHELDPTAPIDIAPFSPPMFGENQIAQFGTYSYFSWGTALPIVAAVLVCAVLWLDIRKSSSARSG